MGKVVIKFADIFTEAQIKLLSVGVQGATAALEKKVRQVPSSQRQPYERAIYVAKALQGQLDHDDGVLEITVSSVTCAECGTCEFVCKHDHDLCGQDGADDFNVEFTID